MPPSRKRTATASRNGPPPVPGAGADAGAAAQSWLSTREAALRLACSLSTVQKMVEAGRLTAWKTSGGHRRIPLAEVERELAARPGAAVVRERSAAWKVRVLIAEDEEDQQRLYGARFASWQLPVELIQVGDGYTALLMIAKQRPDVVIMDLRMPRLDGLRAIQSIRSDHDFDDMAIIVVTGVPDNDLAHKLPPDVMLFRKPVDFRQLQGFMQACVARRQARRSP